MGNSSSTNNLFIHCNIYPDPPDLRDKFIDLNDYYKFINSNNEQVECDNTDTQLNSDKKDISLDTKADNKNINPELLDQTNSKSNMNTEEEELNLKPQFRKLIDLRANIDVLPIYNLTIENVGMTAVNSIGAIIYSLIYTRGGSLFCPSRCYIMYNTLWKDNYFNELTENRIQQHKLCLRDYLKGLKRFGICDEKNYTYQYENLLRKPSEVCYNEGKYLQFNYFRVPIDLNIIKYLLSKNHMILCNLSIYNSFLDNETKRSGKINLPQDMDSYLGMLACCIVGYTENNKCFILRFPFGVFWGDKGYGLINYEYGLKLINDLWIITVDIPFIGNLSDLLNKNDKNFNGYMNQNNNMNLPANNFNNYCQQSNNNCNYYNNQRYLNQIIHSSNNQNSRKYKIGGFSAI